MLNYIALTMSHKREADQMLKSESRHVLLKGWYLIAISMQYAIKNAFLKFLNGPKNGELTSHT
jgi:hypothetical protein